MWQPIETAPKGGTEWILLGYFLEAGGGGPPVVAWWNGKLWQSGQSELNAEGYYSPTHWMPLPAPPDGWNPNAGFLAVEKKPMTIRLVRPEPDSQGWPYWLCEETGNTADLQPLPYPREPRTPEQREVIRFFGGSRLNLTPYQDSGIFFDVRDPAIRAFSEYRSRLFWRRHAGAEVALQALPPQLM